MDAEHRKEINRKNRFKPDNQIGEFNFNHLTQELAGEVDGDFMQMGPKEQRIKRLNKYRPKKVKKTEENDD